MSRELEAGWVVWVGLQESRLLHRKVSSDEKDPDVFCTLLDCNTLKVGRKGGIPVP